MELEPETEKQDDNPNPIVRMATVLAYTPQMAKMKLAQVPDYRDGPTDLLMCLGKIPPAYVSSINDGLDLLLDMEDLLAFYEYDHKQRNRHFRAIMCAIITITWARRPDHWYESPIRAQFKFLAGDSPAARTIRADILDSIMCGDHKTVGANLVNVPLTVIWSGSKKLKDQDAYAICVAMSYILQAIPVGSPNAQSATLCQVQKGFVELFQGLMDGSNYVAK